MSNTHSVLSLDIIFFFLLIIFVINFIAHIFKKIIAMSTGSVLKQALEKPQPAAAQNDSRRKRLEKERDELRYGFPMPPPSRTWVKPQPVIEKYAHERIGAPAQPGRTEEPPPPPAVDIHAAGAAELPKEESRLEKLLKNQDPVLQGVLMSVIMNPPRAMRRHTIARPL